MTHPMPPAKQSVADFWEREACGERYGVQQDQVRYQVEPEILRVAQFETARGKKVLEIGVDLTSRAVELSRERLVTEGLPGTVMRADAEQLPFAADLFDVVWSWGVLHPRGGEPRRRPVRLVSRHRGRQAVKVRALCAV